MAACLPRVIGLCGYAGAGKDTAAAVIAARRPPGTTVRVAFADPLRALARELDPYLNDVGYRYVEYVDALGYETAKRSSQSMRDWLVRLGDGARRHINENVWLDAGLSKIRTILKGGDSAVTTTGDQPPMVVTVTDVRYRNEADAIRALGGEVWYVSRPGVEGQPLERDTIRMIPLDRVLSNDGTIDDLAALCFSSAA